MAIPDISGLTEAELEQLATEAGRRLFDMQHAEETNRAALLAPSDVAAQIAALVAVANSMTAIVNATNADINAGPAPYIKDVARGVKRCARNTARLLRVVGNQLDAADIGTPEA